MPGSDIGYYLLVRRLVCELYLKNKTALWYTSIWDMWSSSHTVPTRASSLHVFCEGIAIWLTVLSPYKNHDSADTRVLLFSLSCTCCLREYVLVCVCVNVGRFHRLRERSLTDQVYQSLSLVTANATQQELLVVPNENKGSGACVTGCQGCLLHAS